MPRLARFPSGKPRSRKPDPRRTAALVAGPLLAVTLLAAAPPPAQAPAGSRPARYAILPFAVAAGLDGQAWLGEGFSLAVGRRLELLGLQVASRRERLDAAGGSRAGSTSPLTLAGRVKLARGMRADRLITGSIAPVGRGDGPSGRIVVSVSVVDLKGGRLVARRDLAGARDEMFAMFDEIALETAGRDGSPLRANAREMLRAQRRPSIAAFESAVRALTDPGPEARASALEAALRGGRGEPLVSRLITWALAEAGRPAEALARLERLDPLAQPDPWRLHLERAELHLSAGDLDAAAASAARSVALRDTPAAHLLLARIAVARGDRPGARLEVRLASALDPEHPALGPLLEEIGHGGGRDASDLP